MTDTSYSFLAWNHETRNETATEFMFNIPEDVQSYNNTLEITV